MELNSIMKTIKKTTLAAIMLGLTAQASANNDLFSSVSDSMQPNLQQMTNDAYDIHKPHVVNSSLLKVNEGALSGVPTALTIKLKEGLNVTFNRKSSETSNSGSKIWQGQLASLERQETAPTLAQQQQNSAVLVERQGNITGTVRYDGTLYRIRPEGNGLHTVEQIDESQLQDHADHYQDPATQNTAQGANASDTADGVTIDVLVAYTSKAASLSGDIDALIDLAITETNTGYSASGINANVNLVHKYQVNYTEASNSETDLNRLAATNDGYMDDVHTLRSQHGADIVLLVHDTNGYCGQADAIYADADSAFAIVDYDCATGYYSFGHELGHLQGARHDPNNDPNTTPFAYGHGYQYASGGWRTVMAYNCSGGCTRQLFWSNPDKTYNGVATGTSSASDNARVLNETASVMAAFSEGGTTNPPTDTVLENGVTVSGLSGGQLNFTLEVPADATKVTITTSGGTGDVDLHVNHGSAATTSSYDCRPYDNGNNEECVFDSPQSGTYHILLNDYQDYSGVSLTGSYTTGGSTTNPSSGTESNLSASRNNWNFFTVEIPAGASNFTVTTSGGSGDADLYIREGAEPTTNSYDCRSWASGNTESCAENNPNAGTWHIGVRAYSAYSGVTLNWSYE